MALLLRNGWFVLEKTLTINRKERHLTLQATGHNLNRQLSCLRASSISLFIHPFLLPVCSGQDWNTLTRLTFWEHS